MCPIANSVKTHFYKDYFVLESWCAEKGCVPVCDYSVRAFVASLADRYPEHPAVAPYLDRVKTIRYFSTEEIQQKFSNDPSSFWLTCGTPFGLCLPKSILESSVERWVGIVGASIFNYGYAGITIYRWIKPELVSQNLRFFEGTLIRNKITSL
jgi:hypothetical protein